MPKPTNLHITATDAIDGTVQCFDLYDVQLPFALKGPRLYTGETDQAFVNHGGQWFVNVPSAEEPSGPFSALEWFTSNVRPER